MIDKLGRNRTVRVYVLSYGEYTEFGMGSYGLRMFAIRNTAHMRLTYG